MDTIVSRLLHRSRLPVGIVPVPRIIRSPDGKILRGRLLDEYKLSATSPG
jgi:hypothetical protein